MRLELFYDVVSPYSFLAWRCLERYRPIWGLDLVLRPFFLGGVMKAVQNTPPAYNAQKAPYLMKDLRRLSSWFDLPLTVPADFPGHTLPAMRLLTAIAQEEPALLSDATGALWSRYWSRGEEISSPDGVVAALATVGVDDARARALLSRTEDPAIKEALKQTTDEAVARGAFGAPTYFVEIDGADEMFFGCDRLALLAHLRGLPWSGPVPGASSAAGRDGAC